MIFVLISGSACGKAYRLMRNRKIFLPLWICTLIDLIFHVVIWVAMLLNFDTDPLINQVFILLPTVVSLLFFCVYAATKQMQLRFEKVYLVIMILFCLCFLGSYIALKQMVHEYLTVALEITYPTYIFTRYLYISYVSKKFV